MYESYLPELILCDSSRIKKENNDTIHFVLHFYFNVLVKVWVEKIVVMKYLLQCAKIKILTQWKETHGQKSLKQAVEGQVPPELSLLTVIGYRPKTEVRHTGKGSGQQNPAHQEKKNKLGFGGISKTKLF